MSSESVSSEIDKILGQRLKKLREARSLTQAALAKEIGVSPQQINYMKAEALELQPVKSLS